MNNSNRASSKHVIWVRAVLGWLSIIFSALLGMSVVAGVVYSVLATMTGHSDFLGAVKDEEFREILAASVPVAVLLGAGAVGGVGLLRQRTLDATHRLEMDRHNAEQVSRLRDRYTAAAGQLGHESAAIRLSGVYALASLADDWLLRSNSNEAQVCVDLLCAYFRAPKATNRMDPRRQSEDEVRRTIMRVIAAHVLNRAVIGVLGNRNLLGHAASPSWSSLAFDLSGATFSGRHDFTGSVFDNDVDFSNATFNGDVEFGASFNSKANFSDVTFIGNITFGGSFNRMVDFSGAKFETGSASFEGTKFDAHSVSFRSAEFNGASVLLSAQFNGDEPGIWRTEAQKSPIVFDSAKFIAGNVTFEGADFTVRPAQFRQATFKVPVPGPWEGDCPPEKYSPQENS